MRDSSFQLEPSLFEPTAPFRYALVPEPPWRWAVRDGVNTLVATARTRAGARAATRWLYQGINHG
jgi:hypothetical protein